MKVSIGTNIKEGPWGGGNLFAINLKKYLESKGHTVIHNLIDSDIDLILVTEPRKTSESSAFTHFDVLNYIRFIKKDTIVFHRINECDERKNTNFTNKYIINANLVSDYTIFVSTWLKDLYEAQGINKRNNYVILAGSDKEIFNSDGFLPWKRSEKLKIVTHHWGANWNKGFSTYAKLDELLSDSYWKSKIEFTYIGNIPDNFKFKNSNHIEPLSGKKLSESIKKNHVYVTASLNEPSGNHHIEAAQCGLPLLYIDSGGIPEYCNGFGIIFNEDNFEKELREIMESYDTYVGKMEKYPFSSEKMSRDFEDLFISSIKKKEEVLKTRQESINIQTTNQVYYILKRKIKFLLLDNYFFKLIVKL